MNTEDIPDLTNLTEWNRWAGKKMTVIETMTILNNRHRQTVSELNQRLIDRTESHTAQTIRIEDTWREKLRESQAQVVDLRDCLEHLKETDWYKLGGTDDGDVVCILDVFKVRLALSTPRPPVVPLADAVMLLEALRSTLKSSRPHPTDNPSMHAAWSTANTAIHAFTGRHPQTA